MVATSSFDVVTGRFPCQYGRKMSRSDWGRSPAPTSAASVWVPLSVWRIGRSFEKEVVLVCPCVNEINIPAAPDLGGAQRVANRGEIWQHRPRRFTLSRTFQG